MDSKETINNEKTALLGIPTTSTSTTTRTQLERAIGSAYTTCCGRPVMYLRRALAPLRPMPRWHASSQQPHAVADEPRWLRILLGLITFSAMSVLMLLYSSSSVPIEETTESQTLGAVQQCAVDNLKADLSFLDGVKPITVEEFLERRDRLARALVEDGVDAFVVEPGFTFQYYGNTSQVDWEPWEPEERPFLMVITPDTDSNDGNGDIRAKTYFLAPHFEEGRVRMLGIPSREPSLDIITWEEHWNPYETLLDSEVFKHAKHDKHTKHPKPTVMVDEEMRDYIVRGLSDAGFHTVGLSQQAALVRQRKTQTEIALLKAVNTGTATLLRALRPCLVPGLTEDQVHDIIYATFRSIDFQPAFALVMFDEDASLPHGGFAIGGKQLTCTTMVVADIGAHYLGYTSDTTRSFLIDCPDDHPSDDECAAEKEAVWHLVQEAQTTAMHHLVKSNTAASVDLAARGVIEDAGYGHAFTHRIGHGIGIKVHESPYLNKWNRAVLQPGMAFTLEPGVYLEGKFGVRHEDVFVVSETGEPLLMTSRRAQGLRDP